MAISSFSSLRDMQAVNLCDGKILGFVCDIEFDTACGKICAIVVPCEGRGLFSKGAEWIIPWEKITCFGEDAILCDLGPGVFDKCRGEEDSCDYKSKKDKKRKIKL